MRERKGMREEEKEMTAICNERWLRRLLRFYFNRKQTNTKLKLGNLWSNTATRWTPIYYTHTHTHTQKYNNLAKYKITYKQIFQQWPITWQGCINSHILPAYSWVLSQRTPVAVDVFSLRDSWKNWFQELIKMNSRTLYIHSGCQTSIFALSSATSTIQIFLLASSIFTVPLGSWSLDTKDIIYCINTFTAQGEFD